MERQAAAGRISKYHTESACIWNATLELAALTAAEQENGVIESTGNDAISSVDDHTGQVSNILNNEGTTPAENIPIKYEDIRNKIALQFTVGGAIMASQMLIPNILVFFEDRRLSIQCVWCSH